MRLHTDALGSTLNDAHLQISQILMHVHICKYHSVHLRISRAGGENNKQNVEINHKQIDMDVMHIARVGNKYGLVALDLSTEVTPMRPIELDWTS